MWRIIITAPSDEITTNGVVSTIAGSGRQHWQRRRHQHDARFYYPNDIAVDSSGNLYVADAYNSTIRKITPVGTNWVTSTIAGQAQVYGEADGVGTMRFSMCPPELPWMRTPIFLCRTITAWSSAKSRPSAPTGW